VAKPLREFTRFIWWIVERRQAAADPETNSQPTVTMSMPVYAARVYVYAAHRRHLLLLLSPKTDTHFTVPQRVESWIDLGGWLHTETVYPLSTVTHLSTNRVWRSATTMIEAN